MQLERFRFFVRYMMASNEIRRMNAHLRVYRVFRNTWYDEKGDTISDPTLLTHLKRTEVTPIWRERRSCVGFIKLEHFSAVACATFPAPPKHSSLIRLSKQVDLEREHAEHAFDAVHDPLTGLLNTKGFSEAFRTISLEHPAKAGSNAAISSTTDSSVRTMAMFAMDIDHFKQINDTYGHLYGDVVIKCLANRLASIAKRFEEEAKGDVQIRAARPSGEEFLMLLVGSFDVARLKDLANRVRQEVCDEPMPTEEEWAVLAHDDAKQAALPDVRNRAVTISIGIASNPLPKLNRIVQEQDNLRNQADLGLYSAKAGGRNVVRHFSEILERHGHVLQHHTDTDVVVIDLGRQFSLPLGQEFRVFHPIFDGNTPFVRSDGRTKKILGNYPRKAIGRIIVFDVQQEISFCHVAKKDCPGPFAEGCHLEAIPIGSISHLVSSIPIGGIIPGMDLTPAEKLTKELSTVPSDKPFPNLTVFTVNDVESLIKVRGTAFVNEVLAQLYRAMKEMLPSSTDIAQLQSTEFAAVFEMDHAAALNIIKNVVKRASDQCRELAAFSCGAFIETEQKEQIQWEVKREFALDYARYALSDAKRKENHVEVFSPATALSIMQSSKSKQRYQQCLEDYRAFVKLGIKDAGVENLAAVCAFAIGDSEKELGFEAIKKAIDYGCEAIYMANLAIYQFKYIGPRQAHKQFEATIKFAPEYEFPPSYARTVAMASYAEFLASRNGSFAAMRKSLEDAKALEGSPVDIPDEELQMAIDNLNRIELEEKQSSRTTLN